VYFHESVGSAIDLSKSPPDIGKAYGVTMDAELKEVVEGLTQKDIIELADKLAIWAREIYQEANSNERTFLTLNADLRRDFN